ncbi:MAG: sigma-70 family RNA polymerase sigma factor [Rhodocyclaceae bacterium]
MPNSRDSFLTEVSDDALLKGQRDWLAFRKDGCVAARSRLIEQYMPFARMLAAKQFGLRVESDSEFDDYRQCAMEGLIEAVDHYDPERGVPFEAFGAKRIRGAILNRLASMSELSAQSAMRARLRRERLDSITSEVEKQPEAERASIEALFGHLAEVAVGLALGFMLEDTGMFQQEANDAGQPDPYRSLAFGQLREKMREAVEQLPERERLVVKYHYYFGFQFDGIAEMLGVTKGRVSQLHKQALRRMHALHVSAQSLDLRY